ncbi:hypothetical protein BDV32DRAFT_146825 [Aspergillus pseudonomiae]|uniref:Rhodopsin domain-containing protein n=1 Tax=Aspergillus pseudonomiae TaxID=1506151 RepID=A0A5N7DRS5_9EURO|nr:uncharacterized protein BDV37DRAFT_278726 [Aspergillus pseudonomiae]KAB8263034.1 hypothetical protein BDV32DRAFT_146825 [Aspergillus pseudonomiae]KAE8408719.1 hypothetical protein BDV37DRAFT_278726 [Aspergillus pseudonomiae]
MHSTAAIVLVGVFGALSEALMLLRLVMRRCRGQHLILSDYLTIACISLVLARSAFATVILVWGNNHMDRHVADLSSTEIYRRQVGSKLTVVNRLVYNVYLWLQKAVVLLLCQRILSGLPWPERMVRACWALLVASFAAVQITTFTDCRPLYLYWQVMPDPGSCIEAHTQLVTLISMNISTDTMLMILPMPWLLRVKTSWMRRLQLVGLFAIGLLLIAIAIVRLPSFDDNTSQLNRNTWGSVEEFLAAFVANVPTLYTLRRRVEKSYPAYYSHGASEGRVGGSRPSPFNEGILVTNSVQLEYMVDGRQKSQGSDHNVIRQDSDEHLVRDEQWQ